MTRIMLTWALFFLVLAPFTRAGETPEALMKKAQAFLAQIDGEVKIPGLQAEVEVLRDRWGVPHIYAKNADDLFFAQGFVAAQDRLFQLELWRRIGAGEMAELLGMEALEGDRFARLVRYRGDMQAEWKSYSPDTQQIATAFTRGINAYIDHIGKKLPIEFQILKFAPRKWQPEDVLGRMSGIIMGGNFQREVARARLIAEVGLEKARALAPTDPVRDFAPVPGIDLKDIDQKILAGFQAASKWQFKPSDSASNNWVVDGILSASGKPMLASDPHRTIAVPSLRYLVHLNAPGWNAIGAGEPGLPGIALGHNDHIAWGITIVGTDQSDIYVETTHPDDPRQYKVGEKWAKMEVIKEKVRVKGKAHAAELEMRFTRHGPVIYQDEKRHKAYALKWSGSEPGGAAYLGGLAVARAKNQEEFLKALGSWKIPALNFVYADRDGAISWVATGLTPVRKGWDGLLPVPGDNNKFQWQRFLEVAEYPQVFNPKTHWVGTANHNILPGGYPHEISYEWASPYRYQVIAGRMNKQKKFTLEDFQSIQHENTSLPGKTLIRLAREMQDPKFLNAIDPKKAGNLRKLSSYLELLAGWDGVLSRESQAGPLYAVWVQELQDFIYKKHVSKELQEGFRQISGIQYTLMALEKPDSHWFGPKPKEERDRILVETFARAVGRTKKLLGADAKTWSWGRLHTATLKHPLSDLNPAIAKAFNLGPVPRSGDANTPNNTRHDDDFKQLHGASYRQIFDLADWDKGLATSTPGQSGQPGSPHYADLLPLWTEGQYFPLFFSRTKVEEATRNRLRLKPG